MASCAGPSTESIAKVLGATNTSIDDFLGLLTQTEWPSRRVAYRLLDAGLARVLDSAGKPLHAGWDEIAFPAPADGLVYALEIDTDDYLPCIGGEMSSSWLRRRKPAATTAC